MWREVAEDMLATLPLCDSACCPPPLARSLSIISAWTVDLVMRDDVRDDLKSLLEESVF